jgi:hypothetical protein
MLGQRKSVSSGKEGEFSMSAATVGFDGSGQDGAFVWWEPGQMRVDALRDALDNVHVGQFLPKASTVPAAIKEMLDGFLSAANLRIRGLPIAINPLASEVRGCEAVQRRPGKQTNDFTHVISVVLDEQADRIRIVSYNPAFFSMPNKTVVEDRMTAVYRQQIDWYPTTMVSACLARVIDHLGGVLCRANGGVYYLPESSLQTFEPLANALECAEGELSITITRFTLIPGERSYRLVAQAMEREANDTLLQVEDALKSIGRQRQDGRVSRTELLTGLAEKVKRYGEILNQPMAHMLDAIAKCQEAVDAHSAIEDLTL